MKRKLFNVLLVSSSLLGLFSTSALSEEIQLPPVQNSFFDLFKGMNRTQNATSTPVAQTNNAGDLFASFFGGINRTQNAAPTSFVQTNNDGSPFAGFFSRMNRTQNVAPTPVAQANNVGTPFAAFFSRMNRTQNIAPTSVAQVNNTGSFFNGFFNKTNQTVPQADMSGRANAAMNTALKTPNLTAFNFNFAQTTSTKNGVIIKDDLAYQVKTTDIFGNSTVSQEGSPNLLNGFNQKPVTVTTPAATTTPVNPFANILANYYKPSPTPIVVTRTVPGNSLLDNLQNLRAQVALENKIKGAVETLLQKPVEEIETLLTDNDQYRALSTIWPTLNNNQRVENTIDYLFTTPQITNITNTTLTPDELVTAKAESVNFVQKSNVLLPNNLEDFVNNFGANVRTIFTRNGQNFDDII